MNKEQINERLEELDVELEDLNEEREDIKDELREVEDEIFNLERIQRHYLKELDKLPFIEEDFEVWDYSGERYENIYVNSDHVCGYVVKKEDLNSKGNFLDAYNSTEFLPFVEESLSWDSCDNLHWLQHTFSGFHAKKLIAFIKPIKIGVAEDGLLFLQSEDKIGFMPDMVDEGEIDEI